MRRMIIILILVMVASACSSGDSASNTSTAGTRAGPQRIAGGGSEGTTSTTFPPSTRPTATEAPASTGAGPQRITGGGSEGTPATTFPPSTRPQATEAPATDLAGSVRGELDYYGSLRAPGDTNFEDYGTNRFTDPGRDGLSTFAVDVDTGAYTLMRAWLNDGFLPDPSSVRVEEYVNYFDGGYDQPDDETFTVFADGGPTPFWDRRNDILRIGIQAREVSARQRQDLNLTFVVDVSGSMDDRDKLSMVKDALEVLVDELDRNDTVSIVEYNDNARVILDPTPADDHSILRAIDRLDAGGSTNAAAGIQLGFDLADEAFQRDAINRVVLLSDGVANVGDTDPEAILERIGDESRRGIDLVTIGVGIATYNDVLMEQLADQGDGWYAYVDSYDEAVRLFREQLTTSLETVARDVKVQVEFDSDLVLEYRLIGFENRDIADDDFRDDRVDAGEINAGHSVTALYEVALTNDAYRSEDDFAQVTVRWKDADSGHIEEISGGIDSTVLSSRFSRSDPHFQVAATVAAYAEVLRQSHAVRGLDMRDIAEEADFLPVRELDDPTVDEFIDLVHQAESLGA